MNRTSKTAKKATLTIIIALCSCLLFGQTSAAEKMTEATQITSGTIDEIAQTSSHLIYDINGSKYYLGKDKRIIAGEIDNIKQGSRVTLSYKVEDRQNNILQIYNSLSDIPPMLRLR